MLQSKCKHSRALPVECCTLCSELPPRTLVDICFESVVNNLESICECDPETQHLRLKENVSLPVEICERLLIGCLGKGMHLNSRFMHIFSNLKATRLKRVKLRNTDIDDGGLKIFLQHRLIELEIASNRALTANSLRNISAYGSELVSLSISDSVELFPAPSFGYSSFEMNHIDKGYIIFAPKLRKLCIRGLQNLNPMFYTILLKPMERLTQLDLSNCSDLGDFKYVEHLTNLTSLTLYNVNKLDVIIDNICKLTTLKHLDVSQSKDEQFRYEQPNQLLATLVEHLSKLTSLDISGTNLAGNGVADPNECGDRDIKCDIPGLTSRVGNPLHFLGLYETHHDACLRHDIPAKLIAGNSNEEQILIAALAYLERPDMLQKVLNELFHLFRFESCEFVGQALHVVLKAMNRHLKERHIQISGSATLFYIVKGTGAELHDVVRVKRKIIRTLLNGMCAHRHDDTMMRNGCLTLCQFKIPLDVVFDYERLVEILLHSVYGFQQESFVQRIGIYLLNSLACQVDGIQKVKLGELGAINKMLWLIAERLDRGLCDDVLEVAWSTMWNVTDETPQNCQKFLENRGMEYFLKCLEKFPDKDELLRNMMGLLGNVAEVRSLRHYLMTPEYISVFSDLLDSISDGIEVSYNAAGVISHIASDGPESWNVKEPSREYVLDRMMQAIDRWDLSSQRNINYRSFDPILHLVRVYDTPECQQWAVWALANLTKVYSGKYCQLVENEGGLTLLQELIEHPSPPYSVKQLASIVIENCRQFREQESIDSDIQLDG